MTAEATKLCATDCSVHSLDRHAGATVRAAVDAIFKDPRVAPLIAHDHRAPGFILHPAVRYLGAAAEGRLAGVFMLIEGSPIDIEIHAALLPWAVRYSRALGRACLAEVFRDPEVMRVSTQVMADLPTALNYCRKVGMSLEGFKPDACSKGGRLVGLHLLGLTRAQWEAM